MSNVRLVQEAAQFTDAQITQIWNLWYDCLRVMLHLKSQEQQLHSLVQLAVRRALAFPGKAANSVLLNTGGLVPMVQPPMVYFMSSVQTQPHRPSP
jgi:hypothetical protein